MRRSAAIKKPNGSTEPASLPDVLVPLSEVPEHQRAAYEIELIDNPEEFRKVLSTENFFSMIQNFPSAWWGERLSMYLYRHEDDGGIMIKNAEGEGKYIKPIIRQAVDRDWIANRNGGGKFQLWLNLSEPGTRRQTTVRKHTFLIDGPPAVKEGQIIEVNGKPVSVGGAQPPSNQPSETAQIITAQSAAAQASVELVKEGVKGVMEMQNDLTRKQLGLDGAQKDPLDTVKTLLEILRVQQPAPTGNSMKDTLEIIDRLDAMAARRNPAPAEHEEHETPIENTLSAIKELSGGLSLADLMKPAARAAAADPVASWAPLVSTLGGVVSQFFEKWPVIQAQRNEAMRLEIHLRTVQAAQPGQPLPALPAAPPAAAPQPGPQAVPQQAAELDPAVLMNAIVRHICAGFEKPPIGTWGEATAWAMDFHFSNAIEALGIADTLADPEKVKQLIAGIPELASRSKDARWKQFEEDFLQYCTETWGVLEEEKKPGPQPVA